MRRPGWLAYLRMTPLTLEYRASSSSSKVTVPSGAASTSLTFAMRCLSKPSKRVAWAIRWYLRGCGLVQLGGKATWMCSGHSRNATDENERRRKRERERGICDFEREDREVGRSMGWEPQVNKDKRAGRSGPIQPSVAHTHTHAYNIHTPRRAKRNPESPAQHKQRASRLTISSITTVCESRAGPENRHSPSAHPPARRQRRQEGKQQHTQFNAPKAPRISKSTHRSKMACTPFIAFARAAVAAASGILRRSRVAVGQRWFVVPVDPSRKKEEEEMVCRSVIQQQRSPISFCLFRFDIEVRDSISRFEIRHSTFEIPWRCGTAPLDRLPRHPGPRCDASIARPQLSPTPQFGLVTYAVLIVPIILIMFITFIAHTVYTVHIEITTYFLYIILYLLSLLSTILSVLFVPSFLSCTVSRVGFCESNAKLLPRRSLTFLAI